MISHLLKEKSIIIVLFFLIYSIPAFAFADEDKTSEKYVKDADYYYNLGIVFGNLGKYQEALDAYKRAIKIKPDYAKAHYNLGTVYGKLGKHQEAIYPYKRAIRIKPDYADAHYDLGYSYFILNDKVSALYQYKILKDLNKELANKLFKNIYH